MAIGIALAQRSPEATDSMPIDGVGGALAFTLLDPSAIRPSAHFRTVGGVVLWLALGVYFAVCSASGFIQRK